MNLSLEKLVKNFSDDYFKYLSQELSGEQLELIKQKGVYLYKIMSCLKRFPKGKFPDKSFFKDSISKTDYLRALKVWKMFKIENMGEHHDLYLKTNVLLLADVFEKFIKTCLKYYKLDSLHYFSSPGLSWDAMFKMTGVELDLISDIDMHNFIEKRMRGGISYISKI